MFDFNEFDTLDETRKILRSWRDDSNYRPHGSLGYLTPNEFAIIGQKKDPEAPKV